MNIEARRIEGLEVASFWDWIVGVVTMVVTCLTYPSWCPVK